MGLLPMDITLLPPSDDRIFKLLLTSPEGKPALIDLISATLRRSVTDVVVRNNELPNKDANEKAERLDVNCRLDDGTQADLEMQASRIQEDADSKHKNIKGKSIYYLCDLHSSQPSKGLRRYDKLAQTYQVTFCSYTVFPNLPDYVNSFSMRHDTNNELLSDAIHVIYVELSKLGEIIKKSIADMTDLEKWALFLQYANIPEYREIVNKVIQSKEALQMAGSLLMSVSKDEREQAVYRSRRMYQTDMQSNIATAEDRGEERGIQIGEQRGEQRKAFAMARNMIAEGEPIEKITRYTGLTREEAENLNV
ncbi:MAG: Rpn family recombination-promoting nuclease/putative transposase [Synergistaceae bacterium]|jgi:predicted transposase/invertase (TIGR01784 family)|nr:Rpn family recombination-promoting nuclease/putative transposase [Synergistaceae bacterium]